MGKAGDTQKKKPKIKAKRQSKRFKETAREPGADQESDALDRILVEIARQSENRAPTSGKELVNYYLKMAIDLEQAGDAQTDPAFKADLLARADYSRQLAAKEAEKLKSSTDK